MKKDVAPLWLIIVMIALLAVAKARGGLDWPWIWVFSPLWLSVVVFSLLVIIFEKKHAWSLLHQIKNYGYLMLGYELPDRYRDTRQYFVAPEKRKLTHEKRRI